jgi:hypothetical protein
MYDLTDAYVVRRIVLELRDRQYAALGTVSPDGQQYVLLQPALDMRCIDWSTFDVVSEDDRFRFPLFVRWTVVEAVVEDLPERQQPLKQQKIRTTAGNKSQAVTILNSGKMGDVHLSNAPIANGSLSPAAQATASPTWIPLLSILVRYPLGSAKLERLKDALKSEVIRHGIDWGAHHIPPLPPGMRMTSDARLVIGDAAVWDKYVNWDRGTFDWSPPRSIEICLEDLAAFEATISPELAQDQQVDAGEHAPVEASGEAEPPAEPGLPIKPPPAPTAGIRKKSSYLDALDKVLIRAILVEKGVLVEELDPVPLTEEQAKNLWRWSKENSHRAKGSGTTMDDTLARRLRAAFKRYTMVATNQ